MKVLLIDVNCKSSSTGQIVYKLYSYLNSHGDEAAVCYGRGEKINEKNIFKFGLDWETYLHAFLTRITGFTGCYSYFSTKRLIDFIERFKPDVIHIHELHAYFVNIKQLLKYLAEKKIPVVHTLHCEFSYTGKCGHSVECEKWKTECGECPHLKDYPTSLWFDRTKSMYLEKKKWFSSLYKATYVAPSNWLYKRLQKSFVKDSDLMLIHNSIDTSIFKYKCDNDYRSEFGLPKDKKIVLAVAPGLMSENKGGKYLLALAKKMPDIYFVLIGADEVPYSKDNVMSLGKIYDKELLSRYYSLADVFVICSKNENFPTTCIEAVCCKNIVVGFDAGGAKEVAPGNLGRFVSYGDVDGLENEIRKVFAENIDIYNDEFDNIYRYYSVDRMCTEYCELYRKK